MKNAFLTILSISTIFGCSHNAAQLHTQSETLSPKEEVVKIHLRNLRYLVEGNAKGLAAAFSSNCLDIGGGPHGTGKVQFDEAYFVDALSSTKYDEIRGREISELVDLEKSSVYSYKEIVNSPHKDAGKKVGFEYFPGDFLILFPPAVGSPVHDGWAAVYRKEKGVWKIIAID